MTAEKTAAEAQPFDWAAVVENADKVMADLQPYLRLAYEYAKMAGVSR